MHWNQFCLFTKAVILSGGGSWSTHVGIISLCNYLVSFRWSSIYCLHSYSSSTEHFMDTVPSLLRHHHMVPSKSGLSKGMVSPHGEMELKCGCTQIMVHMLQARSKLLCSSLPTATNQKALRWDKRLFMYHTYTAGWLDQVEKVIQTLLFCLRTLQRKANQASQHTSLPVVSQFPEISHTKPSEQHNECIC